MKTKRIQNTDGDWYVATSSKDWPAAIERSRQASKERHERMTAWEQQTHPSLRTDSAYWRAYNAEKYRIPIEWPMPEGHVMFKGVKAS